MNLKTKFIVLAFLLNSFQVFSTNKIDSLLLHLKSNLPDTERAKTMLLLADKYKIINAEKGLQYAYDALKISEKGNYKKQTATSFKIMGAIYFENEKYDSATKYFNKAVVFYDENGSYKNFLFVEKRLALMHFYTSNYNKSLEIFFKCLQVAEKNKDSIQINSIYGNIGNIYKEQGKYVNALLYYNKTRMYTSKQRDTLPLIAAYINTGNIYYEMGKEKTNEMYYDSALYFYSTAMHLLQLHPDSSILGMLYCNMGNAYTDKKQYQKAITLLNTSLIFHEKLQDYSQIAIIYEDLASCYLEINKFDSTKKYLDLGLEAAKENHSYDDLQELYKDYATYYEKKNNYQKAYQYYILYKRYGDSLLNDESIEKRKELEMNFSFEKERAEKKLENDKHEALRAEEVKRDKLIIATSIGAFIVLLLIAIIIYRNFKRSQKAHTIISKQKNEIEKQKHFVEEKNKEVMDSIHYAKRIQGALLTSENYIKKYVTDFFILYKPKDIVSGDFYWALNLTNKFYLATADCTGHGVPGAFMSLLNISFLNEVLIEKKITQPDLILNEIRNDIIKALNPEGNEAAKDGMDCSICCFDFEKMELQVAAANNPVWIVRDNKLLEIKPDKMPVGMYTDEPKPFSLQVFKLEKGDTVYAFTDGYADQFGGPKGKKFKYKQLEEKLIANNDKPLAAQKEILLQTFDAWKEGLEQIDDVLLIGIKI